MKEFFNNATATADLALYLHLHCMAAHPASHLAYRIQRVVQAMHASNIRLCQTCGNQKAEDRVFARLLTKLSKILANEPSVLVVSHSRDPRGPALVITGSNSQPFSVAAYAPGDEDHEA